MVLEGMGQSLKVDSVTASDPLSVISLKYKNWQPLADKSYLVENSMRALKRPVLSVATPFHAGVNSQMTVCRLFLQDIPKMFGGEDSWYQH